MADIVGPSVLPLHCPTCLLAAAAPEHSSQGSSQDSGGWSDRQTDGRRPDPPADSHIQDSSSPSRGFLKPAEMR